MKILVVGCSFHLSKIILLAYPNDEVRIIPWRNDYRKMIVEPCDLIFIVGYDYDSYAKEYDEYMNVNVKNPLLLIKNVAKTSTDIVYVSTQSEISKYTYSRYRYAKEALAYALKTELMNVYIVRFDTFKSEDDEPFVKGGAITVFIFRLMARMKFIKTHNMMVVSERLQNYKIFSSDDIYMIKGILIWLPRSRFLDRLLRFLFA